MTVAKVPFRQGMRNIASSTCLSKTHFQPQQLECNKREEECLQVSRVASMKDFKTKLMFLCGLIIDHHAS